MTLKLGIDTGGTYTDAVLVEHDGGAVLAAAKALTTRADLSIGIGQAVAAVFAQQPALVPAQVGLVALSTTLATNAIVEGQGCPVCLLLLGYDPELIRQYGYERDLVAQDVVYLRGGHDGAGNEVEPLDEAGARAAILAHRERVEAFAVSGYFGVRNPAHELRVRALIEELAGGMAVTCGHELTTRLNAVRRATTAALNARLIPLLRDLIATVRQALDGLGVAAPLMVVKGDGSLVRADWARRRPIETVLSGPAASVVGAWHLAQPAAGSERGVWVVDVGGTTTDIAALRDGRPRLNPEGAQVGGWQTMVEAVDVHTVGLGGDSLVRFDNERRLLIGPRRVVPLSLLAAEHPKVLEELRWQVEAHRHGLREGRSDASGQFVLRQRRPGPGAFEGDREMLAYLDQGPQALSVLLDRLRYGSLVARRIEELEARQWVLRAAFTPTDALHALGRFRCWNVEAAQLGAELLAARAGLPVETFCERVVAGVSERVAAELVGKVLGDEGERAGEVANQRSALLARALGRVPGSELGCRLTLQRPLVAIGAPVGAYMPRAAELLGAELIVPCHADVANAVGAVSGGVVQQLRALIRPSSTNGHFRLHLPDGVLDFAGVEEGVGYAQAVLPPRLEALARQAGADQVEVRVARVDRSAPVSGGWGQQLYLETELTFTAVGRPKFGTTWNLEPGTV